MRDIPQPDGGRVQTGAVQFGDDWKGLFIRGDDCGAVLLAIKSLQRYCHDNKVDYAFRLTTLNVLEYIGRMIEEEVVNRNA